MVAPPESSGATRLRTTPPTWKSGMALQHTSEGVSSCDAATHTPPTASCRAVTGTAFFRPVEPDVCSTSATPPPLAASAATSSAAPPPTNDARVVVVIFIGPVPS